MHNSEKVRGSGTTTALMLRAIADSVLKQRQVEFKDHAEMTYYSASNIARAIREMAKNIGLSHVGVTQCVNRVFVDARQPGVVRIRNMRAADRQIKRPAHALTKPNV
jgi:hypothetical protein